MFDCIFHVIYIRVVSYFCTGGISVNVTVNNLLSLHIPLLDYQPFTGDQQQQQQRLEGPCPGSGHQSTARTRDSTSSDNWDTTNSSSRTVSAARAGFKAHRMNVFDKHQLNKPYLTLLAVADPAELLTLLHTVAGEQAHLLASHSSSVAPGAKKTGSSLSISNSTASSSTSSSSSFRSSSTASNKAATAKKACTPLHIDVDSSAKTTTPTLHASSLRARAIAAGCLVVDSSSCSLLPGTPSSSSSNSSLLPPSASTSVSAPAGSGVGFLCSPQMLEVLAQLNPTLSFAEIRHSLNIPLGEVSRPDG